MLENDLTYKENRLLRKIALLEIKKETTIADLLSKLEMSRFNYMFNKLLKMLIYNKIVLIEDVIGRTKFLKVNNSLLREFIEQQKDWDEFTDYAVKFKLYSD